MAQTAFEQARNFLLTHRFDYETAARGFRWPGLESFNWAIDYFDCIAEGNSQPALWIVNEDGSEQIRTFHEMAHRSNQVANFLADVGVSAGDRVLLMLGNDVALWETFIACMKLRAVIIPAATTLIPRDLDDRLARGNVRHVVTDVGSTRKFAELQRPVTKVCVGGAVEGWRAFNESEQASGAWSMPQQTNADDPLLLYFTSGTTALPKLVLHSHYSYPVGHLSTMYWIGLQPGDVHWNISSPGWAKHAWSCVFAPWNAGATSFVLNYTKFTAVSVLETLARHPITTLCAPPTVWRMLIRERLADYATSLREAVSAGEPLNPEVIEQVKRAWNLSLRDGYGQTETTALIGNSPGQPLKSGSVGRALPGYVVDLIDATGHLATDGEVCVRRQDARDGLMLGYAEQRATSPIRDGRYHTGDVASKDDDGYVTFIGRTDDVFKASDYRVSPFELESALLEHPAVAEAAVVPSPDSLRHAVPKAFVALGVGYLPSHELAREIFIHSRAVLPAFKQIRILEFRELPKTISGKIRRVELKLSEAAQRESGSRARFEFFEKDFSFE